LVYRSKERTHIEISDIRVLRRIAEHKTEEVIEGSPHCILNLIFF
jgi:hypothetical protein